MRTRQEVTTIVAELCSRIALLFPQDKIEAILFGSYGSPMPEETLILGRILMC